MVYFGACVFKDLNTGEIKPEESFTDAFIEEVYESERVRTSTKLVSVILYSK